MKEREARLSSLVGETPTSDALSFPSSRRRRMKRVTKRQLAKLHADIARCIVDPDFSVVSTIAGDVFDAVLKDELKKHKAVQ